MFVPQVYLIEVVSCLFAKPNPNVIFVRVQSAVKTFLLGFGNGWLKYCAIVSYSEILGWAVERFESDSQNLA